MTLLLDVTDVRGGAALADVSFLSPPPPAPPTPTLKKKNLNARDGVRGD